MTDISQLTNILRQFAEHKRQQAEIMSEWKPGKLITSEKIRRLQHEAQDLIGYADEIEAWWESRTG